MNRDHNRTRHLRHLLPVLTALVLALQSSLASAAPAASATASERAEAKQRYESTDRGLLVSTATLGASSGLLLVMSLLFHRAASKKTVECLDVGDLQSVDLRPCQQASDRLMARNITFTGFALTGVGAIVTGVLLAKHRREGPQRFTATGDGFVLRF